MWYINEWHDVLRLGIFLVSFYAAVTLFRRRHQHGKDWTTKTHDYWFALLMWTFVGLVVPIQAMILDRPFTPATVVMTAAVLVTAKGLRTKGAWGGSD